MKTTFLFFSTALLGMAAGIAQPDFDPRGEVSACLLWLDAADIDGDGAADAVVDGAAKANWTDKSGQSNDAAQRAPDLQPACAANAWDGKPALRFNGDDYFADTLSWNWSDTDWTLFAVASLDADAANHWRGIIGNRFGQGAANWWTLGTKSDGTTYLELAAGHGVNPSFAPGAAGPQIYCVTKRAAQFTLDRNGRGVGAAGRANVGGNANQLRIGRWYGEGQGWDGDIAEIILYSRPLTDTERKAVTSYLSSKWGIPVPPDLYAQKHTWPETMLASRQALTEYEEKAAPGGTDWVPDLWQQIEADFPVETNWMKRDAPGGKHLEWFRDIAGVKLDKAMIGEAGEEVQRGLDALLAAQAPPKDPRWLELFMKAAANRDRFHAERARLARVNVRALRLAIRDLTRTFPNQYKGDEYLGRLDAIEERLPEIHEALDKCDESAAAQITEILEFNREVLLANPLMDFTRILLIKRSVKSPGLGLVNNWVSNCGLPRTGFDDEIAVLSPPHANGELTTLYRPEAPVFVGDVDLHFDADKMLFSSIGSNNCWQIFEIKADGTGLRQVTPGDQPDVDSYDACYLPDGRVVFSSSAYMAAVACVNGSTRTANLYIMDADGANIRQLCFDQEHNWCPTVLNNGRVMYLRWEYTDTPHTHDRVLFHMNPDGTGQMEYYGSNSYWPNSLFYARPIPRHPTQFVGIVSGHHGVPRMGELVLFDPALGRREADGALQRIPGHGKKVESATDPKYRSSLIADNLVDVSWPKFLHPCPLSGKYFLVSCKSTAESLWGVYLVDVFDNMLLLKEEPGYALFEPIPFRKTPRPPVIPDRVNLERKDAVVYLTDVCMGEGLKGIPRGTAKKLRLFTYHFLYPGMGGPQAVVGMEGPWDIRQVMGTVPVEEDGSASFRVPANTPIAVQPLDDEGKALQLMRSWFTGMPGETLSCVGCHESQNSSPPVVQTIASRRPPSEITPWYGPTRGFSFEREVQPVLDRHCVACHNGGPRADGTAIPDFKERAHITDYTSVFHHGGRDAGHFSVAYANLHRYVRRPGLESDYHLLTPMEFHADTTQLVQMLEKGHSNVELDAEAWDRIITWIDMNAPFHGTWTEIAGKERVSHVAKRRRELLKLYAGMDADPEAIPVMPEEKTQPVMPEPVAETETELIECPGWPFDAEEAERRQATAAEGETSTEIDLGDGVVLEMVLIPAGEFVMGSANGYPDERPRTRVEIEMPFWMGRVEVTNRQFALFDPLHDSAVESKFSMQFGVRGFYVNGPEQPVVRVSWKHAMAFCEWLSERTGIECALPTEAQWEYACRAGTDSPFFYGDLDTDFSAFANLADEKLREFVCHTYKKEREPWLHASKYDDWIPKDTRFNDGGFLSDGVGNYRPNPWGLHDMHGNVWEWTRSRFKPYPYCDDDDRNNPAAQGDRVVRGGSWRDRPCRARSSFRLAYRPYQPVYNVGFRVVCPAR